MTGAFQAALDDLYGRFGVDVTMPLVANAPVRGLYEDVNPQSVPLGTEISELVIGEPRVIFSFRRSEVTELSSGTLFEAPESSEGPILSWRVESVVRKTSLELAVLARQVR